MDPKFCLEQPYAAPVRDTFGVDDLDAALESDDVFGQAYAAATSLLVHCIEAAKRDNQKFGFGYPRVARCLLKHIDKIWSLAEASDSRYSAMATMRAYYKRKIRSNQQLTQEMVHAELTEAALSGYTIELCRGTPAGISGPFGDLYERAAMAFLKDRFVPNRGRVKTPDGLLDLVKQYEEYAPIPPLGCDLTGCELHPPPPLRSPTKKRPRESNFGRRRGQWI